jgi:hypothetical protein
MASRPSSGAASVHPLGSTQTRVAAGERFGWGIEIRPIHDFESKVPKTWSGRFLFTVIARLFIRKASM